MGGTVTELGVVAETVNKQQEREIIYRIAYIHFCKFLSRAFCILNPVFCSPPLSRKLNIIHLWVRYPCTPHQNVCVGYTYLLGGMLLILVEVLLVKLLQKLPLR